MATKINTVCDFIDTVKQGVTVILFHKKSVTKRKPCKNYKSNKFVSPLHAYKCFNKLQHEFPNINFCTINVNNPYVKSVAQLYGAEKSVNGAIYSTLKQGMPQLCVFAGNSLVCKKMCKSNSSFSALTKIVESCSANV